MSEMQSDRGWKLVIIWHDFRSKIVLKIKEFVWKCSRVRFLKFPWDSRHRPRSRGNALHHRVRILKKKKNKVNLLTHVFFDTKNTHCWRRIVLLKQHSHGVCCCWRRRTTKIIIIKKKNTYRTLRRVVVRRTIIVVICTNNHRKRKSFVSFVYLTNRWLTITSVRGIKKKNIKLYKGFLRTPR